MNEHYFDWAATSPTSEEVLAVMDDTASRFPGNPSSSHRWGKSASSLLYDTRNLCSGLLGCRDDQLVFTSGGSESNAIVLSSLLWKRGRGSVVIPSIEHPSVTEYRKYLREIGFQVISLDAPFGFISSETLASKLREDTVLVSFSSINNTSGAIQDLEKLVSVIRNHENTHGRKVHVHLDAVQALGKIPLTLSSLDIDSASFSAHKLTGPRGVGCLYLRSSIEPLSRGGSQEYGLRPGTENLPGIAGFVKAMELNIPVVEENLEQLRQLRKVFIESIPADSPLQWMQDLRRIDQYSPYIMLLSAEPIPSEVLLRVLNDRGFYLSAGSACCSKTARTREGVLTSMGFSTKIASGALRISLGSSTSMESLLLLSEVLHREAVKLKKILT